MNKDFIKAEEKNTSTFASEVESKISGVRVHNIGDGQLVVMMDSGAVATIYPVTGETCDLFAKDAQDKNWDLTGISWDECLNVLRQLSDVNDPGNWWQGKYPQGHKSASLSETNSTSVDAVSSAKAFAPTGQKSNRAIEQSQREGWTRIREDEERDQTGRKKVSPIGQPEDPLGRLDRTKRTDEQSSVQVPEVLEYLAEMLPADSATIDNGKLSVAIDSAEIVITPQDNGNFSVQSFVGGQEVQANENVPAGDLVRWSFEIVNKVQERVALTQDDANSDVSPNDAYSVLRELALATGAYGGDDIIRNKDLFDLKQGLVVSKSPFSGRRFFGSDFNSGHSPDAEISGSLKGGKMKDGVPVSINENRDCSKPYSNTLGGKKLVWLPHVGATLVDKSQLPPQKKLSWDAKHGVILADENAPSPDRRNMWKHHWQP